MATAKEFSELNDEELNRRIGELRQGRFDKRLQHRIGELQNSAELTNNRKDLARALTVQRARQLKADKEKAAPKAPAAK
jgi:large subunit ribosomal protein L29